MDGQTHAGEHGQEHHQAVAADRQSARVAECRQHKHDGHAKHGQHLSETEKLCIEPSAAKLHRQQQQAGHRQCAQQKTQAEDRQAKEFAGDVKEGLEHFCRVGPDRQRRWPTNYIWGSIIVGRTRRGSLVPPYPIVILSISRVPSNLTANAASTGALISVTGASDSGSTRAT